MHKHDTGWRAALVTSLIMLAFAMLVIRLAQMQLLQHDQFSRVALAQRFHTVRQEAPRGEVLDRYGQKLATSRPAYRLLLLYPSYVTGGGRGSEPSPTLRLLASLLEVDYGELERQVREKIEHRRFYEPLVVKDDLTPGELAQMIELRASLPGIYVDVHPLRHYLYGEMAAHLLGHLGPVDSNELSALSGQGYRAGDQIGKMGLELSYDQVLRGTPGLMDLEVDAAFRPTNRTVQRMEHKPGFSIRTTLDLDLQRTVESALVRTLLYVSKNPDWNGVFFPKTNAGAAVVMDVKTGGILAMASHPSFDPNLYVGVRDDAAIQKLDKDRLFPLYNRAIRGQYLPGSTWKMLSAASALEHGVVTPREKVFCGGVYDKLEFKKDWKPDGHGEVDVVSALANSCNIYFYEMGYRLGIERLADTAKRFGFGAPLGIDLPGEAGGWIPDEARRKADSDPGSWRGGKLLSAAIGQGPTATPLQLARYAAVLANGGLKVRPHLVSAVLDSSGNVVRELTPPPDGRVELAPEVIRALVDGMKAVTEWGTSAYAFAGMPFKVAGKTGTAEVVGAANCEGEAICQYGVYVAFAPADSPEIAVAVVGERAGHGDSMNPVARAAIARYFKVALAESDPLYTMGIMDRRTEQSAGGGT